jgi:hypothetical protein
VVVDVPLLFHLGGDRAAVVGAQQQSRKCELVFLAARAIGSVEYPLHDVE